MPTATKQHEGVILRVHRSGYCFIGCVGFNDAFAHFRNFSGFTVDEMNEQLKGRRVVCQLERGPRGYEAFNIRPAQ